MYPEDVKKAIYMAGEAHIDDKWGDYPYMVHLALVAEKAREVSEGMVDLDASEVVAASWLHDVIEDHPEFEDSVSEEFPKIFESLGLLNRDSNVPYDEYIQNLIDSLDPLALVIKLSDMTVNLNNNPPGRLKERYERNIGKLEDALWNINVVG